MGGPALVGLITGGSIHCALPVSRNRMKAGSAYICTMGIESSVTQSATAVTPLDRIRGKGGRYPGRNSADTLTYPSEDRPRPLPSNFCSTREISGSHGREYNDCFMGCCAVNFVEIYRRFRGDYCLHHQDDPDDGGSCQSLNTLSLNVMYPCVIKQTK
jgi:hypothetical protein